MTNLPAGWLSSLVPALTSTFVVKCGTILHFTITIYYYKHRSTQHTWHSVCLPRQVECLLHDMLLHTTLCFIKLISHSITCGTARVTVYVILMSTTLHSHILAFYDSLYTVFNRRCLFKLKWCRNNFHIHAHTSSDFLLTKWKASQK